MSKLIHDKQRNKPHYNDPHFLLYEWMKVSDKIEADIFGSNFSIFWNLPMFMLLHFYKIFAVIFWQSPSGLLIFALVFANRVDIRKASWMLDKEEFPRKMFKNHYITVIAITRLQMQSGYF